MTADTSIYPVVWQPGADLLAQSNLAAFLKSIGISNVGPVGYQKLLSLAQEDPTFYWDHLVKYLGIRFFRPYDQVLDTRGGNEWARWCVGAQTNSVLNALDRHQDSPTLAKDAIVWYSEKGERVTWDYGRLTRHVSQFAQGMRARGIGRGDVVGIYMPMLPEAISAMLAVNKIGAIFLPLFSGFGAQAVVDRLRDAGACAIVTADGTWRRGKHHGLKATVDEAIGSLDALRHVIVVRNSECDVQWNPKTDCWIDDLIHGHPDASATEVMDAEDPMMIMYTSGTTGKPKGTVHSHVGLVTKVVSDMVLFADLKTSDRFLWISDLGWFVGPLLTFSATFVGATIVIAEGAHDFPSDDRYWGIIERERISYLGISPSLIRGFMMASTCHLDQYDVGSLRVIFSSGEPWTYDAWMWTFHNLGKSRLPIINYSGGTEIGGGIVTGTVIHPMKPCAFSAPVPGVGADISDESGASIPRPGSGELVMRQPSVGLTRGLWNDNARYLESYWGQIHGVWVQGDRATVDMDGYWYITGRSDDTLKIAGKRTGPSEIEGLVLGSGLAGEAAAIGIPDDVKGESVGLFVTLMPGVRPDDATRWKITTAVTQGLGSAFSPKIIYFVDELPKTRNMKIMRRLIRSVYLGSKPGDLSSLVNPESLDTIRKIVIQD
ncbi:AMP-binding protein [Orrella marina]|uniref:acetate--CoA ligase n=1 Tax=Orrella marina TaxID=2163011 RepID=A0A2R4XGM6_9BURK|nr:AMP-binding protein [Orrella marina]AWB32924.1 AMP-dependent synthetase [Orrella marina]